MSEQFDDERVDDLDEGWALPPIAAGDVRIMADRCSTCSYDCLAERCLEPGRVRDMLASVRKTDSFVTCHKTLGTGLPGAICKGSSDAYQGQLEQVARRLGRVVELTDAQVEAEAR